MNQAMEIVGFTDRGAPVVSAEHTCPHWSPGKTPTLNSQTCWYCRYADFRKTDQVTLLHSVCRCPGNRVRVLRGSENENPEETGGCQL